MASRKAKWLQKQMRRMQDEHSKRNMSLMLELAFERGKRIELSRAIHDRDTSDAAVVLFRRERQTQSGMFYHFGTTIDSRWLQYRMHKIADGRFTDFSEIQYDIERKFHYSLTKLIEEIANK